MKEKIEEFLTRGVNEVIDSEDLKRKLLSGEKLKIKLGIDPTSPNIHLGRAVTLLKLRDLQEMGHEITFLIGDFTGVIGDTSDKESERPMLDEEIVIKNMESYVAQAGKILDLEKINTVRNSDWLSKLTYKEISRQSNVFSLAEFIQRENIKRRIDKGMRISLREVLYPLMQGYDSVVLEADLELGGTDQRFNLLAGRELQREYGQNPQNIMMLDLIEGTDGRKMSSSWGNTINVMDEPNEMFGKIMSMGDDLIVKYFIQCTRVPMEKIADIEKDMYNNKINPRDAKLELAEEIVRIYHGDDVAKKAKEYFINTFSKKEIPDEVLEFAMRDGMKLVEFMVEAGLAESLSDARRKIEQGGVEINGEKVEDAKLILTEKEKGAIIKVGKKSYIKIS